MKEVKKKVGGEYTCQCFLKEGFQKLTGDTVYNLLARTWFVTTLVTRTAKRLFWVATCLARTQGFKCHRKRGGSISRDS